MHRRPPSSSPRRVAPVLAAGALAAGALLAPSAALADPAAQTAAPGTTATAEELTPNDLAELAQASSGSDGTVTAGDVTAEGETASIRTSRGAAYFYHWGDTLRASDYLRDGYGIRAQAIVNGTKYTVHNTSGADTGEEIGLNLPEGQVVWLTLCYTDNGKNVKCSDSVQGRS